MLCKCTYYTGAYPHMTGAYPHMTGAYPHMTGAYPHITGAYPHMAGAYPHTLVRICPKLSAGDDCQFSRSSQKCISTPIYIYYCRCEIRVDIIIMYIVDGPSRGQPENINKQCTLPAD